MKWVKPLVCGTWMVVVLVVIAQLGVSGYVLNQIPQGGGYPRGKYHHVEMWAKIARASDLGEEAWCQRSHVKSPHLYASAANSNLRHHAVSHIKRICRPGWLKCYQFVASRLISASLVPGTSQILSKCLLKSK